MLATTEKLERVGWISKIAISSMTIAHTSASKGNVLDTIEVLKGRAINKYLCQNKNTAKECFTTALLCYYTGLALDYNFTGLSSVLAM